MNINFISTVAFLTLFQMATAQKMPLQKVGSMIDDLEECSGITVVPSGHIAMINDSGNRPALFFTDEQGNITKNVCLAEISNVDWEDISYADGYLYIGDFGNNKNKRKDLVIYKYSITATDSVTYHSEIHFRYADQRDFGPGDEKKIYDLEALVVFNDSIFIFTKNRTKPFTGYTYQYGMPAKAGRYNLTKQDSFKTGTKGKKDYWWISAAALSPDKSTLTLLGYDKMWTFQNFEGSRFFQGERTVYQFKDLTQKEGITFLDNQKFMITDERNRHGGGDVFIGKLPGKARKAEAANTDTTEFPKLSVSEEEFTDSIVIHFSEPYEGKVLWELFATNGSRVTAGNQIMEGHKTEFIIDGSNLKAGGYVLNVILGNTPHAFKLKKLYPLQNE